MVLPGTPTTKPDLLFHFSEDPDIQLFEPRAAGRQIPGRPDSERLVWAIDERHSPMYLFPRDCPRIILWAYEISSENDIQRWIGDEPARMVAHIESAWSKRLEGCELFKYTLSADTFESINDHGTHVSSTGVKPLKIEPLDDLRSALKAACVELREVESLQSIAAAWKSSVHFSGIRLRNAHGWVAPA